MGVESPVKWSVQMGAIACCFAHDRGVQNPVRFVIKSGLGCQLGCQLGCLFCLVTLPHSGKTE